MTGVPIGTRTGDGGVTGLGRAQGPGDRLGRHGARVAAYASVDEANSAIGLAKSLLPAAEVPLCARIDAIQLDLFRIGTGLTDADVGPEGARMGPGEVRCAEDAIDREQVALTAIDRRPRAIVTQPG